jgi:hypothetical protein
MTALKNILAFLPAAEQDRISKVRGMDDLLEAYSVSSRYEGAAPEPSFVPHGIGWLQVPRFGEFSGEFDRGVPTTGTWQLIQLPGATAAPPAGGYSIEGRFYGMQPLAVEHYKCNGAACQLSIDDSGCRWTILEFDEESDEKSDEENAVEDVGYFAATDPKLKATLMEGVPWFSPGLFWVIATLDKTSE